MKSARRLTIRPDRAGGRARCAVALSLGLIAAGLLISGCGGSSPTGSAKRPTSAAKVGTQFVAFAVCMRSHGVPNYPDPRVSGSGTHWQATISPGGADPNSPAFKSAGHDCHDRLPDGGKPAQSAQDRAQDLTFAGCMRSHGVPDFPDADRDGAFTLPSTVNQQAPQFENASHACMKVQPSSLSINQAPASS